MLFKLNDKLLYKDKECEVVYINAGMAWIAASEDKFMAIAKINKDGKDDSGLKVKCINNKQCAEV